MQFQSNLTKILWIFLLVIMTATFIYLASAAFDANFTWLGYTVSTCALMFGALTVRLYFSLYPEQLHQIERWRNSPVDDPSGAVVTANGRNLGTWFFDSARFLFNEDAPDEAELPTVRLPNGRLIGGERLYSVLYSMGLTHNTSRTRWVGAGDHMLKRYEWEGVLMHLDRCGYIERVDGRGKAVLKYIEASTWNELVKTSIRKPPYR